mgnify:CR=1 FL=1
MSKKYEFIDFLVYISIITFTLRATFFNTGNLMFLGIFFGLIIFIHKILTNPVPINIIFYIILIFLIAYFTFINNGFSMGTIFLPHTLACIGISWRIYTNGINHNFVVILFYALMANFLYQALYLEVGMGSIYSNSNNHISTLFLNLLSLMAISSYINNKPISLLPVLLLVFASITAIGNSGIFASLVIFIGYVINKSKNNKSLILIVFTVLLALFIFEIWSYLTEIVAQYYNPNSDMYLKLVKPLPDFLLNSERFLIAKIYINQLSSYSLLFGSSLDSSSFLYGLYALKNLHNSFLLLHSRGGFLAIIVVIVILYAIIHHLKNSFFLGICLIAIIVRSIGDTTLFATGAHEYIFTYLILFYSKKKFTSHK